MEIWKDINDFDNYQASSFGRIRSKITGKVMSPCKNHPNEKGYYHLSLTMGHKKRITRKVHILVCIAFHGSKPTPKHTVNHKDGNKLNNVPDNLEWMTPSQQMNHSYSVLNNDEVRLIRKLHRDGFEYHRIRTALGNKTSWVAIQMIITGKIYTHITD